MTNRKEYQKAYYLKNRKAILQRTKAHYSTNRKAILERHRASILGSARRTRERQRYQSRYNSNFVACLSDGYVAMAAGMSSLQAKTNLGKQIISLKREQLKLSRALYKHEKR